MKLSYLSLILVLSCACGQPGQEMYPDIADAARTSFCVASDDTALVLSLIHISEPTRH